MTDAQAYALEIVGGLVVIPWCAWVTTSIFAQRTQIALMKSEVKILNRIERLLSPDAHRRPIP